MFEFYLQDTLSPSSHSPERDVEKMGLDTRTGIILTGRHRPVWDMRLVSCVNLLLHYYWDMRHA